MQPSNSCFSAPLSESPEDIKFPDNAIKCDLRFDLAVFNSADDFVDGGSFDFADKPNQQVRVDLISPVPTDPFIYAGPTVTNIFTTAPKSGGFRYKTFSREITGVANKAFRLRFAEVDTNGPLNAYVDNVKLSCVLGIQERNHALKFNEGLKKTIKAGSFVDLDGVRVFAYQVPERAALFALRVRATSPQANVDALIGQALRPEENPRERALFALTNSLGEEFLILFQPQPGPYWIAVENLSNADQEVEVIALAIFDIQALLSGQSIQGQVNPDVGLLPQVRQYLRTQGGFLSPTQHRIILTEEQLKTSRGLRVTLRSLSGNELKLHLRYERAVELSGGRVHSDLTLGTRDGKELEFVLAGNLLKPGSLFFVVESLATGPLQSYELRAELLKLEGVELVLK